jgi:hypothetical protein
MALAGWFLDSPWWWLALWLPSLGFCFCLPVGSGRKEHRS